MTIHAHSHKTSWEHDLKVLPFADEYRPPYSCSGKLPPQALHPPLRFRHPAGVLSCTSTEHNPKEDFSIISVLGLTMRRLLSNPLSPVLYKTKPAHCKGYPSQGFSCRINCVSLGRNQNGSSSCSVTIKAKGGQWQHNLAHRKMQGSELFGVCQTEF